MPWLCPEHIGWGAQLSYVPWEEGHHITLTKPPRALALAASGVWVEGLCLHSWEAPDGALGKDPGRSTSG
jgi:hypothetical protein